MDNLVEATGSFVLIMGGIALAIWLIVIFPAMVFHKLDELKRVVVEVEIRQIAAARFHYNDLVKRLKKRKK